MWADILKNQITVARQNVKTKRSPLPEKEEPKQCWPFFEKLIIDFVAMNTVYDPESTLLMPSTLEKIRTQFPNEEYWCEFKENYEVIINGDLPSGKNETNATYIILEGFVNNGKEKVSLSFQFSIITAYEDYGSLKNTEWTMGCHFFYKQKNIEIYKNSITALNWKGGQFKELNGVAGARFFCRVFYEWKSTLQQWLNRIQVNDIKYYGWPKIIIDNCELFDDLKKSQVQIGSQKVKTKRTALPEKDDPEDCWEFWKHLIVDWKIMIGYTFRNDMSVAPLTDRIRTIFPKEHYWCEFKETMQVKVVENYDSNFGSSIFIEGKVNNGKEKVSLNFTFGLVNEGKTWNSECYIIFQSGYSTIDITEIHVEDWGILRDDNSTKNKIKLKCKVMNNWIEYLQVWLRKIGSPSMTYYGFPEDWHASCDWGDMKKSQVQIGRQNIKTKKTPLPEKEDNTCRDKIVEMLIEFEEVVDWITGKNVDWVGRFKQSEYWNLPDKDWCDFIEDVKVVYESDKNTMGKYKEEWFSLIGNIGRDTMYIQLVLIQGTENDSINSKYYLKTEMSMNKTGMWTVSYQPSYMMDYDKHNLEPYSDIHWQIFKTLLEAKITLLDSKARLIFDKVGMESNYIDKPLSTFPDNLRLPIKFK